MRPLSHRTKEVLDLHLKFQYKSIGDQGSGKKLDGQHDQLEAPWKSPRRFEHLHASISSPDALCCNMGDSELGICSSKMLTPGFQSFVKCLLKNCHQPNIHRRKMKKAQANSINEDQQMRQIFVHLCGACLSMQVNMRTTTVRKLIKRAMKKTGMRCPDVYVLWGRRVLDNTQLLSVLCIARDASLVIIPRLRAGVDLKLVTPVPFSVFIKDMKPFYRVNIPSALQKKTGAGAVSMIFLSQAARYLVQRMIICVSMLHAKSHSLAGKFDINDFFFCHDFAILDDRVTRVKATTANCICDFRKLSEIIVLLFKRPGLFPTDDDLPAYVGHLVDQMRVFVNLGDMSQKSALRSSLSNHCALMSFRGRLGKIVELERFYFYLGPVDRQNFRTAVGYFGDWARAIVDVEVINDAYMYNDLNGTSRFTDEAIDWLEVSRKFYSHPNEKITGSKRRPAKPIGFNEEEADAAMALYWQANLAELLLRITRKFDFPQGVDKKLLWGNEMADQDARNGQSGGVEFEQ
ncbi:hypothetical protein ACP4OV_015631 [Aristida adscensionis]